MIPFKVGKRLGGVFLSLKAGRAEEHDRVLDLLTAEAGQRFLVFRQNAQDAAIGAAQKRFILVSDWCGFRISHDYSRSWRISADATCSDVLVMLVVVKCLPESDPDVEQAQAAADPAEEPVRDHGAQ